MGLRRSRSRRRDWFVDDLAWDRRDGYRGIEKSYWRSGQELIHSARGFKDIFKKRFSCEEACSCIIYPMIPYLCV